MDASSIFSILKEFSYVLLILSLFITLGLWKGRYFLIRSIISLQLSLLLFVNFPYFHLISASSSTQAISIKVIMLVIFFTGGVFLLRQHIPGDDYEKVFEGIGKKVLLAIIASCLVLVLSYQLLSVSGILPSDSALQTIFTNEAYLFWWLLAPLVILAFL